MIAISPMMADSSRSSAINNLLVRELSLLNGTTNTVYMMDVVLSLVEELTSKAITAIRVTGISPALASVITKVCRTNSIKVEVVS